MSKIFLLLFLALAVQSQKLPSKPLTQNIAYSSEAENIDIVLNYLDSPIREVVWCGEEKNVVFFLTEKSTVYRSHNDGFNSNKLTEHLEVVGKTQIASPQDKVGKVTKIQQSPVDKELLLFQGTKGINWVTEDCGITFKAMNQGRPVSELQFHPIERNWILASAWTLCEDFEGQECHKYKELFMTKDLGANWEFIEDYVYQFSWGQLDRTFFRIPKERIIICYEPRGKGHQNKKGWSEKLNIAYSDDFFKTKNDVVKGGNKFLLTSYFLFTVIVHDEDTKEINMLVSNSKDKTYNFRPIELPGKKLFDKGYSILDTSEHSVFLHVNQEGQGARHGNVYVSDSTGVRYSLSLKGNAIDQFGQSDFERLQGLEGIYVANVYGDQVLNRTKQMNNNNIPSQNSGSKKNPNEKSTDVNRLFEDSKRTMISFDKGGMWQPVQPPMKDVQGKRIVCLDQEDCSLHLHAVSGLMNNLGPFYSTENSLGLILGTGNVGKHLSNRPDEVNTYFSRDGGLNWFEIGKGSHLYEIGDHGSIIVMAPSQRATTQILYTWDEGITWNPLKISDQPIHVTNIIIEPTNTAEKFLVFGTPKDNSNKAVLVAVDFTPLQQRWCQGHDEPNTPDSDYETWTPNGKISPHCLLGKEMTFIRRKRAAKCFNSEEHETWKSIKPCQCTEEDWECDFGFSRNQHGACLPISDKFKNISQDPPVDCEDYYYVTQGYRKIGGNMCRGGVNHEPNRYSCPGYVFLTSKNLMTMAMLLGIMWFIMQMNNKSKAEKVKGFLNVLYNKISAKIPSSFSKGPIGFRRIEEIPDSLRDEEDDFGKIVFEDNDDGEESLEDSDLWEVTIDSETKERRMTERKGVETARKRVPILNKPREAKQSVTNL